MKVVTRNTNEYVHVVGGRKFYMEYEVKVQAYNIFGKGPNSTAVVVFSAEDLPIGVPTKINTESYNATAVVVSWLPVRDSKEVMKGKVLGYTINYWDALDKDSIVNSVSYSGQVDSGFVIGLLPNHDYCVNIQVFNTAGMGPPSEISIASTTLNAPLNSPRDVRVYSHGPNSISVTWRGLTTGVSEVLNAVLKIL